MRSASALRAAAQARPAPPPPPPPRRAAPPAACHVRASRRASRAVALRRRAPAAAEAEAAAAAAAEQRADEPPRLLVTAARDAPSAPSAAQLVYFNRFASIMQAGVAAIVPRDDPVTGEAGASAQLDEDGRAVGDLLGLEAARTEMVTLEGGLRASGDEDGARFAHALLGLLHGQLVADVAELPPPMQDGVKQYIGLLLAVGWDLEGLTLEEGRALRAAAAAALGFELPDDVDEPPPPEAWPEEEPEPEPPAPPPASAAAAEAAPEAPPSAPEAPPAAEASEADRAAAALVERFEALLAALAPRPRRGDGAAASTFASMLAASARVSLGEGRGRGARFSLSFAADTLEKRGDAPGAALLMRLLALLEGSPADAAADAALPPPLRQLLDEARARAAMRGWPPQQSGVLSPEAAAARRDELEFALRTFCDRAQALTTQE